MKNDNISGLNILDGSLFFWEGTCGEANASTISFPTSGVLPRSIAIRSHRTGMVKVFDFAFVDSTPDEPEETALFTERNPANPSAPITVCISNC
jgi:hypothetical protein